jgi:hypothetical protein
VIGVVQEKTSGSFFLFPQQRLAGVLDRVRAAQGAANCGG